MYWHLPLMAENLASEKSFWYCVYIFTTPMLKFIRLAQNRILYLVVAGASIFSICS